MNTTDINNYSQKNFNLEELLKAKYSNNDILSEKDNISKLSLKVGDIIRLGYKIFEGDKERIQFYEGLIISIKNRGLSKTIMLRRNVQGIGVEQIFSLNSPKIVALTIKQSSKVRRSKLYFIRALRGKAERLKVKR
jgi:large subunit ribosomal protein L19